MPKESTSSLVGCIYCIRGGGVYTYTNIVIGIKIPCWWYRLVQKNNIISNSLSTRCCSFITSVIWTSFDFEIIWFYTPLGATVVHGYVYASHRHAQHDSNATASDLTLTLHLWGSCRGLWNRAQHGPGTLAAIWKWTFSPPMHMLRGNCITDKSGCM